MALEVGSVAPGIDLPTYNGGRFRLSDQKGKAVVVYFYPKDDTSGCTKEAQEFTALAAEFTSKGVTVVGISPDSPKSHGKFREKYGLAIQLASDEEKAVAEAYGVWVEKSMYGKKYMGIERSTFLIDTEGKIAQVWSKVKVPGHAAAVLQAAG
jgi:peroxiredoxin Q/BCP